MINDVVISGYTGENLEGGFRFIKTETHDVFKNEDLNFYIRCLYWNGETKNTLTKLSKGTLVIIKGRLESDENNNTYVLVEQIDVPKNN